eukprot:4707777-Prymnesium_polylepis.1
MRQRPVERSVRQLHVRRDRGRRRGNVKGRLARAAAWFAVGCIAAARMPWRLRSVAASDSAGTTTLTSTPACGALGCGKVAKDSAACGAGRATPMLRRCVVGAPFAITTAYAARE